MDSNSYYKNDYSDTHFKVVRGKTLEQLVM
jgi:hypothetical protein